MTEKCIHSYLYHTRKIFVLQENTLIILLFSSIKMLCQGEQHARSLRTSSLSQFKPLTARQLFHQARSDILSTSRELELVYDNMERAVSQLVAASLDEDLEVEARCICLNYYPITKKLTITMPTWIHDSHSSWMKTGLGFAL